jgi:hypothetical protein
MYSVLVVAYKRPYLLKAIIDGIPKFVQGIYIHVDKSPESDRTNAEVIEIVQELQKLDSRVSVRIASSNLGPGRATPKAVDWALEHCLSVLVLEDDCLPNANAYEFFRRNHNLVLENYVICGTSPYDFQEYKIIHAVNTSSTYALISGWMIGAATWNELNIEGALDLRYWHIVRKSVQNPRLLLPLSFFYASIIRIRSGHVKAWDSMFCFSMIMNDIFSLIPNVTVIDNLGFDSVASNTRALSGQVSNVYNKSSDIEPSHELDLSADARRGTDFLISKRIYNMGLRNYLSPAKSFLRAYRDTQ